MIINEWLHAARLYLALTREVSGASSHAFVDRCFWRIWRQGADLELFDDLVTRLARRELARYQAVLEMTRTPQHQTAVHEWRGYSFVESLHLARCAMVRKIPPAQTLVDIGGAAQASIQGALLVMGYPHRFQRLTIVDLPPEQRLYHQYAQADHERLDGWIPTEMGQIRYGHGSMTDLSAIEDASVDLVFSGQSIEHVSLQDGQRVSQEVYRILKPGGAFFLDTPNAKLTRLQSPNALIHPEHQIEYTPTELAALLKQAGFGIHEVGGICPMPRALQTGIFDEEEIRAGVQLSADADQSYLFYIHALKP